MLSTKYPIQFLTQSFRNGVRCMCKKPEHIGTGNVKWAEKDVTEESITYKLIQEKINDESRTFVRPEQVGTGDLYVDNTHLTPPAPENPIHRTGRILADDIRSLKNYFPFTLLNKGTRHQATKKHFLPDLTNMAEMLPEDDLDIGLFPSHVDICIIGGGAIGSSIAYFLKEKAKHGLKICVIEKDKTYTEASSTLSVGGLRQQFSLEENIQMSLFGADFLRNIKSTLGEHVNINFMPYGYLFLASEEGAQQLHENSILQNRLGAKNMTLTSRKLNERFPWLNTDGIALGCLGLEKEGWFDPWSLLMGFKHKAQNLGVDYVDGEAINFEFELREDINVAGVPFGEYEGTNNLIVKMDDGSVKRITFATCIIAAGAQSGNVARLARIGNGPGLLSMPLPVEPRKRYVYSIKSQGDNLPGINTPLTIDTSQTYFRRDGLAGNFLVGRSPDSDSEPSCDNLHVDYDYFQDKIWPSLAHRVPAFESAKVCSAWSGFYEYNRFDENGIIGPHPYYINMYIATGFSGHGIQQAPAVGRAISELILDGTFTTIDLTRLGYDRLIVNEPMLEHNIV